MAGKLENAEKLFYGKQYFVKKKKTSKVPLRLKYAENGEVCFAFYLLNPKQFTLADHVTIFVIR